VGFSSGDENTMKRILLTLAACLLDVYSMEAQSPFPNFTDEQLTAINAIPFGQCKPPVRQIVAHAKKAKPSANWTGFGKFDLCKA